MDKINAVISAVGGYLPPYRRTNQELERLTDTSDEWITKRTGIKERRILADDVATSDMAVMAVQDLVQNYKKDLSTVDVVIFATATPDMPMPSTASILCQKLGIQTSMAFDINVACSGFLYALDLGTSLIESGKYQNILIIGADKISAYVNLHDRSTNILFGDGAGVVWLEASQEEEGVIYSKLYSNGEGKDFLHIEGGGTLYPNSKNENIDKNYIKQDGKVVFKHAIEAMSTACKEVVSHQNLSIEDINWLVPHQANKRIINAVGNELGISEEKTIINIEYYGNTIAATLPLCLWENAHKMKKEDLVLLTAFGAGFSWGATLLKWQI